MARAPQPTPRVPDDRVCPGSRAPYGVTLWVVASAVVVAAGWVLSAVHQLNARGYLVILIPLALACLWSQKGAGSPRRIHQWLRRGLRRYRRPMPLGFLILAMLALVGGVLHAPDNYDALAYRVPRVLHWLAHGEWHWIHTAFPRLDVRACGQEWLMAPVIALTGSVHGAFLISFISFILLPGLFFSVFIRVGVKPRTAWFWMWLMPTGYCFAMQAGGIANDLMGAAYALAAFDFALRLRRSGRVRDWWLFLLAAALLTGAKASNILLLPPLFLIICPRWPVLLEKPVVTALVGVFAALASFLPTAFFNWKYAGDWTGMALEGPMEPYLKQFGVNSVNWVLQNLAPPVFPLSAQVDHFLHSTLGLGPEVVRSWHLSDMAEEGGAGLGLGVSGLLIVSILASLLARRRVRPGGNSATVPLWWQLVVWSPYASLLVFWVKAQTVNSASRLITPYWPALIAPWLLFCFDGDLTRRRWWRGFAGVVFLAAIGLVIIGPSRPLWPARTILNRLHETHPSARLIARARAVYDVYGRRPEGFAPLAAALPADARVFGLFTFDDPEASLWLPVGSRQIEHVTPDDTSADLAARGINYVLAPANCRALSTPVESLIQKYHADVVKKIPLFLRVDEGNVDWYILKVGSP